MFTENAVDPFLRVSADLAELYSGIDKYEISAVLAYWRCQRLTECRSHATAFCCRSVQLIIL